MSPQLNLVHMLPEKGQELIQKQVWTFQILVSEGRETTAADACRLLLFQVFSRKLEEVGRVLFLISLTQHMPAVHKQSHVSLLQEDLLRLPSFPRTAIDAEFSLFNEPQGERDSSDARGTNLKPGSEVEPLFSPQGRSFLAWTLSTRCCGSSCWRRCSWACPASTPGATR